MRLTIDKDLCGSAGMCAWALPEVFVLRDDGIGEPVSERPDTSYYSAISEAVVNCPLGAIKFVDEPT